MIKYENKSKIFLFMFSAINLTICDVKASSLFSVESIKLLDDSYNFSIEL